MVAGPQLPLHIKQKAIYPQHMFTVFPFQRGTAHIKAPPRARDTLSFHEEVRAKVKPGSTAALPSPCLSTSPHLLPLL